LRRKTHRSLTWEGWDSYRQFAERVKAHLRYVRSKEDHVFLDTVFNIYSSRKLTIPKGRTYWRARLGCPHKVTKNLTDRIVLWRPYSQKDMKPISNWLSEGRVNPRVCRFNTCETKLTA
jgi:hypothetical protein